MGFELFVFLMAAAIWLWNSLYVVRPGEQGIVLRLGRMKPEPLQPGMRLVLWPVETLYRVSLLNQGLEVEATNIEAADGECVSLRCNLRFRITDAGAALSQVADYRFALRELCEHALRQGVARYRQQEVREELTNMTRSVRDRVARESQGWGIHVEDFLVVAIEDS